MTEQCYVKKDSHPPVCGVHEIALIRKRLSNEMIAAGYKGFSFLVCPVSGVVLNDEASQS
jgi:hypothetical protein